MNCVIYARVSSKEQETEGFSIPSQLKLLKDYALKHKLRVIQEYIDVETAKTTGRVQFGKMTEYLDEPHGECHVILVEKTDRLYRNIRDWLTVDELDVEVHFVKENVVLSKESRSSEKFFHGIRVLMAKNYIDNLSEEVKKGMREKAEQGEWPNKAPLGYLNNKETHQLEVDPERGPIIAQLFELYSTGRYSITAMHEKAKELGLKFRRSNRYCSRSNIERILKNPIYTGRFVWNAQMFQGIHKPIISETLFDQVQTQLARVGKPKTGSRDFAFRGILTCGYCGCAITAEIKKGKYVYYRCTYGKGKCKQPYLREERLAEMLAVVVARVKIDSSQAADIKKALRDSFVTEREFRTREVTKLRREQTRLQDRLDQSYIDKIEGRIETDFWRKMHDRWVAELNSVARRIQLLETANRNYYEQGVSFLELAQGAYSLYLSQSVEEKAKLLRLILSNCILKGETLCPTYNKPFNLIVKSARKNLKLGDWDSNPDSTVQSRMPYHWTISQYNKTNRRRSKEP